MGKHGIPKELILQFQRDFASELFVETGTFQGTTTHWASQHFRNVLTIEASPELYHTAKTRLKDCKNIEFKLGSSDAVLEEIANTIEGPTVFWLDGHWSGGETYGAQNECPIRGELHAISQLEHPNLVLIDDASYFLAPPPRPHCPEQWPSLKELMECIDRFAREQHLIVFDDVMIVVRREEADWLTNQIQDLRDESASAQKSNLYQLLERVMRLNK